MAEPGMAEPETTRPKPAEPRIGAAAAADPLAPVTLADSLVREAGWGPAQFGTEGPNPPYLRIGGRLRLSLSAYEPCFAAFRRDRGPFRSKVGMAEHLAQYDALMVDPIAFEECFGPGEGTETVFPFGAWLTVRRVGFGGLDLWGKRQGAVTLPLEPLTVASAIWLRRAAAAPDARP
ncbi:hypothetical protein BGCPKDLD_1111 [Methylorubrum suomiense]|uniref:Uncharacterized protein n=2 Tax=Methylorubrum suomiense TaxID=144191 RepID=A0ABQ4URC3_9HYPH|nr:hypothetical protein BGCPKDLD_1111 [Methylorubrum suomiense]